MTSSDQYRSQIMNDLAQGNVESLDESSTKSLEQQYENFDDFAQRSSHEERRHPRRGWEPILGLRCSERRGKLTPDRRRRDI